MKSMWKMGLAVMIFSLSFMCKVNAQTNQVPANIVVQQCEGYVDNHDYKHQFEKNMSECEVFVESENICVVEDNYKQQAGKPVEKIYKNAIRIETERSTELDRNYKHQSI